MHSDLTELLLSLNRFKVRFLIIGGYAFGAHAEARYTKDLDIWVDPAPANAANVFRCLSDFGAPVSTLAEKDFATPGMLLIFGREPNRVDILNRLKGLSFAVAYKKSIEVKLGTAKCRVVSLEHLIKLKRLAGRPQDLLDLSHLMKIRKHLSSRKT